MSRAAVSICPLSTPCRAHVGSEWCRLCQDSPNDRIASQFTFRDLSLTSNSSLPKVWQVELMDEITWCRTSTRTRLAQKNAATAPCQDQDHRPPMTAGAASEMMTSSVKCREILAILASATRSGQNFACDVWLPSNIQPMCAQARPLLRAFQSSPNRHGECGSPSLSLYLWCRRWSATQVRTGPSRSSVPATASAILNVRVALNEP